MFASAMIPVRLLSIFLYVLLAGLVLGPACIFPRTSLAELTPTEVEDQIFSLINIERHNAGLDELVRDPDLDTLARQYSSSGLSREVQESSDLRYLLSNSWWASYKGGSPRLDEGTAREQLDFCLGKESLKETIFRSDARATGVGVGLRSDTVYYTQVFDILNAAGANGRPVKLQENPDATDPSWYELKEFLVFDGTDEQPYVEDEFVCADFAAALHDRAEAAGLRAGYVSVEFQESPGHALNAFQTADRGLVFIDCTGKGLNTAVSGETEDGSDLPDYDKVAYIDIGREYGLIGLDRAAEFSYSFYEYWDQQWDEYRSKIAVYLSKREEYEAAVAGRTTVKNPHEYATLKAMQEELDKLRAELDTLKEQLGTYRWQPLGIVSGFYVHW